MTQASYSGNSISVASVKVDTANVYSQPTVSSAQIASLHIGEEYPIVSVGNYFYKIQMLGGQRGWVKKTQVQYKKENRIVMGWNYGGGNTSSYTQQSSSPSLGVVSPRWFSVANTDPMVSVKVDPTYVQWAHENGKTVWPLFGNQFDADISNSLLSNPAKRQRVVATIKDSLVNNQIDGINVDFENISIKNKADFAAFIQELSAALHPFGKVVSVDVTRTNPDPNWSGSYDRRALGKFADYVILMGYDEHWSGAGKAGSVASLPWTDEGIRLLMNEVPSHKIVLGVPFYTREWITDAATGKVTNVDRTMRQVDKLITDKGLQKTWDAAAQQNYVEFTDNGQKHQIWVEDQQSMQLRKNQVNQYRLIGVAGWFVGAETPDVWPIFDSYR